MPINATDGMVTITVKKKRSIDAKLQYILAEGRWLKDATGRCGRHRLRQWTGIATKGPNRTLFEHSARVC